MAENQLRQRVEHEMETQMMKGVCSSESEQSGCFFLSCKALKPKNAAMILLCCEYSILITNSTLLFWGRGLCLLWTVVQDVEGAQGVRVQGDVGERELATDKGEAGV